MRKTPRSAALILLMICFISASGCETLRKKFTRKRKPKGSTETVVIVPRDYSAHPFPNEVLYKQYFAYWKSWNMELVSSLAGNENYKKIDDCAVQSLANLKKMRTYLNDGKAKELDKYINKTEILHGQIEVAKNMPPSRMNSLRYDAERILSNVNRKFDGNKAKPYLKPDASVSEEKTL
ncbi:MAG TPA: hypothetical protein PLU24_05800 [Candidatus Omnitrophota bacterium]|nr:hypothetical protein [Candidatus Omnitrophota bacterium]